MATSEKPLSYFAQLDADKVLLELGSTEHGLSFQEAERRLDEFGYNKLVEEKRSHILVEFFSNFKNPLVLILLSAASVSFILGERIDAVIIFCIVFLSIILNFFQEYSANKAAQKLKEHLLLKATVLRDGKEHEVFGSHLCVGDIIILNAGDLVPADARVISAKDFFVNQSSLTGESFPIEKHAEVSSNTGASLSDLHTVVYSGSNVEIGTARAVVVKIGQFTEFGKISAHLVAPQEESDFNKGVGNFSVLILRLTIFFVIVIFFFNTYTGQDVFSSLLFSLAVAVGLTPELLPMIMSITMAKGSVFMAKKGVIVKRLAAIPNFGSMDVLCTDKTGTLTEDKIELVKYIDLSGKDSERVLLAAYLNSFFQTGIKNPMDDAVVRYRHMITGQYAKVDEIPFDFVRKKMSVVVDSKEGRQIITKGAPEEIFTSCSMSEIGGADVPMDPHHIALAREQYEVLSRDGYRALAVAVRPIDPHDGVYTKHDEKDLILIGFVAFLDPAKKDVKSVLAELAHMGITVKVITGDSELVTQKICQEVGLPVSGVLLGHEIDSLTDDALSVVVERTTIFARFSPDEKSRVISALKRNGHVVGYMGDGINDAPSLKHADVGISVDNAVDVAKESAAIILTHRSLRVLRDGIVAGRATFANTMKYIKMGMSANFGNMFSVLGAVIFLPFLPMLPLQILLNNLLYDFSQITIPGDAVDLEDVVKPQRWNMHFIKKFMYVFGPISSLFDFVTFFVLYSVFHLPASGFQTGWFLQSLATQTFVIYVVRTRKIPFVQSLPNRWLIFTTLLFVGVGWILPYSSLGQYFGFVKLDWTILLSISGIVVGYLVVVEITKRIFYAHVRL